MLGVKVCGFDVVDLSWIYAIGCLWDGWCCVGSSGRLRRLAAHPRHLQWRRCWSRGVVRVGLWWAIGGPVVLSRGRVWRCAERPASGSLRGPAGGGLWRESWCCSS
eukprot:9052200-Pyramimonas_sp.AAC.1